MEKYRFKTEEEMGMEYGERWRMIIPNGWVKSMDYSLGTNVPSEFNIRCELNETIDYINPLGNYSSYAYAYHRNCYTKIKQYKNGIMKIKNGLLKT